MRAGTAAAPASAPPVESPILRAAAPEAERFDRDTGRRSALSRAVAAVLLGSIRFYQWTLGPLLFAGVCRFSPSCSRYGAEAIRQHGPWRGVALLLRRLSRCRPFGGSGYDPVPDARR